MRSVQNIRMNRKHYSFLSALGANAVRMIDFVHQITFSDSCTRAAS